MRIRQVLVASGTALAVAIATIGTATADPGQGLSTATTNAGRATAAGPGTASAAVRDADAGPTDLVPVLWMLKTNDEGVRQALDGQLADILAGRQPQFLSADQIAVRFGGSASDIASVGGYLQGKNYQPELDATHSFFQTQMTAADIAAELLTPMGLYHMDVPGGQPVQFLAADQAPTVPVPVANSVTGVTGLRTALVPAAAPSALTGPQISSTLSPPNVRTGTPQGCAAGVASGSFTPNQLLTAYGVDKLHQAGFKGEGTRLAIVSSAADPGSFTGFTACYPEIFGSPAQINGRVNYRAGPAGPPGSPEGNLDLQAISMSVPNAERIDFFRGFTPAEQTIALAQLIDPASYPDGRLPDVVSFSEAGGVEGPCFAGTTHDPLIRDYLVAAVHRTALTGVTVVYSSGDGGGYSTQSCSMSSPVFVPNDSPYVTSVGGTNLWLNPDNTISAQGPWNTDPIGGLGAGGGGVSQVFTNPYSPTSPPPTLTPNDWPNFQDGAPAAHGALATSARLLPDVSGFASDMPGETFFFLSGGGWVVGEGTSFSAPFFAGSTALLRQKAGRPLGQLNGYLYRAARSSRGADYSKYFYDITEGNTDGQGTGCCDAGRGYDEASGLGSVKFDTFADFVAPPPQGPPADPAAPQVQSTSAGPIGGCVTVDGKMPANGTRRLMKPGCVTNGGQKVGVSVGAQPRGDMHFYTLFCQTSNGHTTKTKPTGYGNGSRYCKKGALKIRTHGQHLRIRITWSSPAVGAYLAYSNTHTYKT